MFCFIIIPLIFFQKLEQCYACLLYTSIEIEDQGIGIPKEDRNKIFLRFFRGDSDIVKGQDGSGVGLYLTRKILEEQGGTVSVKSGGEGSTFVVQIPL